MNESCDEHEYMKEYEHEHEYTRILLTVNTGMPVA